MATLTIRHIDDAAVVAELIAICSGNGVEVLDATEPGVTVAIFDTTDQAESVADVLRRADAIENVEVTE